MNRLSKITGIIPAGHLIGGAAYQVPEKNFEENGYIRRNGKPGEYIAWKVDSPNYVSGTLQVFDLVNFKLDLDAAMFLPSTIKDLEDRKFIRQTSYEEMIETGRISERNVPSEHIEMLRNVEDSIYLVTIKGAYKVRISSTGGLTEKTRGLAEKLKELIQPLPA